MGPAQGDLLLGVAVATAGEVDAVGLGRAQHGVDLVGDLDVDHDPRTFDDLDRADVTSVGAAGEGGTRAASAACSRAICSESSASTAASDGGLGERVIDALIDLAGERLLLGEGGLQLLVGLLDLCPPILGDLGRLARLVLDLGPVEADLLELVGEVGGLAGLQLQTAWRRAASTGVCDEDSLDLLAPASDVGVDGDLGQLVFGSTDLELDLGERSLGRGQIVLGPLGGPLGILQAGLGGADVGVEGGDRVADLDVVGGERVELGGQLGALLADRSRSSRGFSASSAELRPGAATTTASAAGDTRARSQVRGRWFMSTVG